MDKLEIIVQRLEAIEKHIGIAKEPNNGDICKFWDSDENFFIIGRYYKTEDDFETFRHVVRTGTEVYRYFNNVKPLTKQEVIKLLFGDEI